MNIVQKGGMVVPKILDNPREIILNHARDIVLNEGYENLTIRAVSKNSGISVGTIYNCFLTKKDLLLQLIEDYWYECLDAVDEIDKDEPDLFLKLFKIYEKFNSFFETFKEGWIKNSTSGYSENGLIRKKNFVEKFIRKVEAILIEFQNNNSINLFLEPYTISKFLILNFSMMAQFKDFEYNDFEKIIKKVLQ
jgi:AcrR family transcriptional regulator